MTALEECLSCGRGMVSANQWRRMNQAERLALRERDERPKASAGECRGCKATRRRRHEDALLVSPTTERYTRAELLDEWERFVDRTYTFHQNCVNLGPRLGMRPHALEKALGRAGVRAWPVDTTDGWRGWAS